MSDFIRCNKVAGIHWLKRPVDQLIIKIKLKLPDDVLSLPKFEDYTNEINDLSLEQNTQELTFRWQEKTFSAYEIQHYSDIHNCCTENELKYHEVLKKSDIVSKKVFSYVHEDYYKQLPQEKNVGYILNGTISKLKDLFERSGSERHLFKSQDDISGEDEQWIAMHVVFDRTDYNEDTPIRQELTLTSIYHNIKENYIILSPDINNDINLYNVDELGYQYQVQVDFGGDDDEELSILLSKLFKKWEKKHRHLVNFVMPPFGLKQYYVTIDIILASGFYMDNLYVEFNIKLPEGVQSKDTLHGRTHVSEGTSIDGADVCNFGHLLELCFESDSDFDPTPIKMFLEIISIDKWHRHRTEGYSYFSLPLAPGGGTQELRCVRPDEGKGEERRFFVGGCHLIGDLEAICNAELQPGNYTYTSTGSIQVRHSSLVHSPRPAPAAGPVRYETASTLLMGAEAALRKYKKARARLALATTRAE